MDSYTFLWIVLVAYGALMWLLAPRSNRFDQFFVGRARDGREVGMGLLVASIAISWLFAKSITNAANLGQEFGLVGAVAYAGWYLSIPVAGIVIYYLRTRHGAPSIPEWITRKYGSAATLAFVLVILVRLMNEVWSNTAVVGAYFGASGSTSYFGAAMVFAVLTLFYSLRGGLRSSILTDAIQFALGVFLLVFVIGLIVPQAGIAPLVSAGEWTLVGGVDLLLVGLLQSFSYPFHDPVLTDRGFLTRPKIMLRAYVIAGFIAAAFIVLFGLTGVYGSLLGSGGGGDAAGQDAPLRVAQSFGVAVLAGMTVLMMVSAGSTLDSTLSSCAKAFVIDLGVARASDPLSRDPESRPLVAPLHRLFQRLDPVAAGRGVMVLAVLIGSLPLFAGTAILKATTVSGTMVLGLAPIFLFAGWSRAGRLAFHFAFWPGAVLGVLHAMNRLPEAWSIGAGKYGALLGANVYGTVLVFAGFVVGAVLGRSSIRATATAGATALVVLFISNQIEFITHV